MWVSTTTTKSSMWWNRIIVKDFLQFLEYLNENRSHSHVYSFKMALIFYVFLLDILRWEEPERFFSFGLGNKETNFSLRYIFWRTLIETVYVKEILLVRVGQKMLSNESKRIGNSFVFNHSVNYNWLVEFVTVTQKCSKFPFSENEKKERIHNPINVMNEEGWQIEGKIWKIPNGFEHTQPYKYTCTTHTPWLILAGSSGLSWYIIGMLRGKPKISSKSWGRSKFNDIFAQTIVNEKNL